MNNSVRGRDVRGNHVAIVHLHLPIGLLQRQRGATGHRVLDLIESHAGGEQRPLHQVLRDELLGHILVRDEVRQVLG